MLYLFLGKSKHWHRKKTIHYKLVPFESGNELFMDPLKKKYYWRSFSFSNFDAEKKCPISSPKYFYRDRISTFLWFGVFKQNDILTTTFHYKLDYLRCVIQQVLIYSQYLEYVSWSLIHFATLPTRVLIQTQQRLTVTLNCLA